MCPWCESSIEYFLITDVANKPVNHFVERCINNYCKYRIAVIELTNEEPSL